MKKNTFLFLILTFSFAINFCQAQDHKDCESALQLCGESPFQIETMEGIGTEDEGVSNTCVGGEFTSIWIQWTILQEGILTFEITPNDEIQDLDFSVYKYNSIVDCSDKELVRCMASGENFNMPIETWEACTGPTGLRIGETDTEEGGGCSVGDNNFLAPLETNVGDQYVMLINEFSGIEAGFQLSFGGDAKIDCITLPVTDLSINDRFNFDIYPTVSDGQTTIRLANSELFGGLLTIYDMNGKKMYLQHQLAEMEFTINTTSYPNGIYVAHIQKGTKFSTQRFVKGQ